MTLDSPTRLRLRTHLQILGSSSGARSRASRGSRLAALFLLGANASCAEKPATAAPAPAAVLVAPATKQDVALFVEAVGALDGYVNVDLRARVKGYLRTQDYKDGATVKAGQLLFTIEAGEYDNAVASAAATVARANAAKTRADATLARTQHLVAEGAGSRDDLDGAVAGAADATGQVLAAQAALRQAQLNHSYTRIAAPVDGVVGLALVRAGNLVGQDGPTLLTTVSQLDPIRVNFTMSEVDYVRFPDRLRNLEGRDVTWARTQFTRLDKHEPAEGGDPGIELLLADGSLYGHRGVLVTANRQIDASTGTIQLQALLPNPDKALRPGQFGRVRIQRGEEGRSVITVPEKALISVQGTYSVGVVGDDNKVQMRKVDLGAAAHGVRIVNKGVAEGERVVVDGVQKITDGALVAPQAAPGAS